MSFRGESVLLLACFAALAAGPAAAAVGEPPICTDRPAKANAVCTVPAGRLQVEGDLISWTRDTQHGVRTETILYPNPTFKLGLTKETDLELNWAPRLEVRTRGAAPSTRITGSGDLVVRLKHRVTSSSRRAQIAVIPFVKVPTATRAVGNGSWEGGIAASVQFSLSPKLTLTLGPELDILAGGGGGGGGGHHLQVVGLVNLARTISSRVTVYGEVWAARNFDPQGARSQYSGDVAIAFLATRGLQLDLGINLGVTKATPATQVYAGLAARF